MELSKKHCLLVTDSSPIFGTCLLGTEKGAKIWKATSRSCAWNDEGTAALRMSLG
jgi:hypothetical protein